MNVADLIRKPELVDELLDSVDDIAREHSAYEYGLPMYNDQAKAQMREAVYRWAVRVADSQKEPL